MKTKFIFSLLTALLFNFASFQLVAQVSASTTT